MERTLNKFVCCRWKIRRKNRRCQIPGVHSYLHILPKPLCLTYQRTGDNMWFIIDKPPNLVNAILNQEKKSEKKVDREPEFHLLFLPPSHILKRNQLP